MGGWIVDGWWKDEHNEHWGRQDELDDNTQPRSCPGWPRDTAQVLSNQTSAELTCANQTTYWAGYVV